MATIGGPVITVPPVPALWNQSQVLSATNYDAGVVGVHSDGRLNPLAIRKSLPGDVYIATDSQYSVDWEGDRC